jgi:hypothetical protein
MKYFLKGEKTMFGMKKKDKRTNLDMAIDKLVLELEVTNASSPEYEKMVKNLEVLKKANSYESGRKKISPDTILIVAANLVGIVLILGYEQASVVTSKALGFVVKGRV